MTDLRSLPMLAAFGLLSACVAIPETQDPARPAPPRPPISRPVPPSQPAVPPTAGFRQPAIMQERGLEGVMRQDATALERRFGTPRLDMREGDMRKLQFSSAACVLDVFLYPLTANGEAVATWVEARRASDGAAVDRASCVEALARRR